MRTNAIIRIVIYSLVILALVSLLLSGLGIGMFAFDSGTVLTTGTGSVDAAGIRSLEIEWVSGSVTVRTGDTDSITFSESGNFKDSQAMVFEDQNGTLRLSYAKSVFGFRFGSLPSKDLVITVPEDWDCRTMEFDGAALEISIEGISVRELDLDGAAAQVYINGAVEMLNCDGAACEITWNCTERPREIDLDGADCRLELTLPKDCGFLVRMDGLSCDFDSDLDYTGDKGEYGYGDHYCRVDADGISCKVVIHQAE